MSFFTIESQCVIIPSDAFPLSRLPGAMKGHKLFAIWLSYKINLYVFMANLCRILVIIEGMTDLHFLNFLFQFTYNLTVARYLNYRYKFPKSLFPLAQFASLYFFLEIEQTFTKFSKRFFRALYRFFTI